MPSSISGYPAAAARPDGTSAVDPIAARSWLGRPIDPFLDPWYRFSRVVALVKKVAPVAPRGKWLDLGCHLGQFLRVVDAEFEAQLTGIDQYARDEALALLAKYYGIEVARADDVLDPSWRYFTREIDKGGLALAERFDVISALEVLEHMVDTDAFLETCAEHLVPGGLLVISTPNINSLRNRVQVPLGKYPAGLEFRNLIHHVRLYNRDALVSHMAAHGFERVGLRGVNFLPSRWLRTSVVRAFDRALADRIPSLCGCLIGVFRKSR